MQEVDVLPYSVAWTCIAMVGVAPDGLLSSGSIHDYSGDYTYCVGSWGASHAYLSGRCCGCDLNTYLPSLGVDLTGWVLTCANGLSYDGSVIVGEGTFYGEPRGWVAVVPEPSSHLLLSVIAAHGLYWRWCGRGCA